MEARSRSLHYVLPTAALLYALIAIAARSPGVGPHAKPLAFGFLADCVLSAPAITWFLSRRRGGNLRTFIGVASVGLSLLPIILPQLLMRELASVTGLLTGIRVVIGASLFWLALPALRQFATAQGSLRRRAAMLFQTLAPSPLVAVVRTEALIAYYALFAWRAKPEVPAGHEAFSYRTSMDIQVLGLVGYLSLVEMAVAHVLIRFWSVTAAWIITELSIVGLVYLVGTIRSVGLRPVLLGDDVLTVRLGLLRSIEIPLADIDRIEAIASTPARSPDLRRFCLMQSANLLITMPSGRIAFYVDEPQALTEAIQQAV